jgi:hypothetical protein
VQKACVQDVLDSIVPALLADKNRKFIFAEQAINTFLSLMLLLIGCPKKDIYLIIHILLLLELFYCMGLDPRKLV